MANSLALAQMGHQPNVLAAAALNNNSIDAVGSSKAEVDNLHIVVAAGQMLAFVLVDAAVVVVAGRCLEKIF